MRKIQNVRKKARVHEKAIEISLEQFFFLLLQQSHLAGHLRVLHFLNLSLGLFSSQNLSPTAESSSSRTQTAVTISIPIDIKQISDP